MMIELNDGETDICGIPGTVESFVITMDAVIASPCPEAFHGVSFTVYVLFCSRPFIVKDPVGVVPAFFHVVGLVPSP